MRFVLHARESALRMPRYTLLKIQQIVEQLMAGTMWLTTHRCVKMASIPIIRAASVGLTVRREKALDFRRVQVHCPPACARFLLGGTCDKVLAVSNGCTEAQ